MAESKEKLKAFWWGWKTKGEKAGLKLNMKKAKIMTSDPITSWQIDRGKVDTVKIFFSWAPKLLRKWLQPWNEQMLAPWKKAMTNLDSILKSREITLLTKVHIIKAMVFPVVWYGCEIWYIKKAESLWIDAFKLWCGRRPLRVPWTASISNQLNPKGNPPWIFIGRTDAEVETPILQPSEVKSQLIGKDPDAGKDWRQKKGVAEDEMVR